MERATAAALLLGLVACADESAVAPNGRPPMDAPPDVVPPKDRPHERYQGVDATSASALRRTLHDAIDDHRKVPYSSSGAVDVWDVLEVADRDPEVMDAIVTIYSDRSLPRQGGGNPLYNREHVWPRSYGFKKDSPSNYPFSDCHGLRLSEHHYNQARANKPYGPCDESCTAFVTVQGDENLAGANWQVWPGRRGDIARAVLYFDVRYEGGNHGATGAREPDLVVTDNSSLVRTTNGNADQAHMGLLDTLLQWHEEDPPDDQERYRNDVVEAHQGNRNPFVDHPEWALCLYRGHC